MTATLERFFLVGNRLIGQIDRERIGALELAPGSEIDAVTIQGREGQWELSAGAPILGPLVGPLTVYAAMRSGTPPPPGNPDVAQSPGNLLGLPSVEILVHSDIPCSFSRRRRDRTYAVYIDPVKDDPLLHPIEVPIFGRSLIQVSVRTNAMGADLALAGAVICFPAPAQVFVLDETLVGDIRKAWTIQDVIGDFLRLAIWDASASDGRTVFFNVRVRD